MKAIEIKNISKSYDKVQALKNVSFEVEKAEIFGLIGPDGAGKTTLFRILTTLLIPDSGEALIQGLNTVTDYKKIRKILGYMPGKFSLYQDLTVEENLNFFASVFGTTVEENYYLIEDIYKHIEPFRKRRAGKLSGGMKQKLALSCALIHKPEVMILDEPTTGVDAVSRQEFWEMLKKIRSYGITVVVSTPYMDEAELCDRVAFINEGKILNIDTPKNIIDSFKHKLFGIKASNMHNLIFDMEKFPQTHSVYAFGQSVHFIGNSPSVEISEIVKYLKNLGYEDIEVKQIQASIEDCFIDMMT